MISTLEYTCKAGYTCTGCLGMHEISQGAQPVRICRSMVNDIMFKSGLSSRQALDFYETQYFLGTTSHFTHNTTTSVQLHSTTEGLPLFIQVRGLGPQKGRVQPQNEGNRVLVLDLAGQLVSGAGPRRRPTPVGPKRREACCSHTLTNFCTVVTYSSTIT